MEKDLAALLWLWKIAAWAMGLACLAYLALGVTGLGFLRSRWLRRPRPQWLRPLHYFLGIGLVTSVLILFGIGLAGTWYHYGNWGHSWHLPAGLGVVGLVLLSAGSAVAIAPQRPWARPLHVSANVSLLLGLGAVAWTGWQVVQQYLP